MSSPKLFQPTTVAGLALQHRVVLAPLTRCRGTAAHVPNVKIMKEYYTQRACVPGTLLISEASFIAQKAGIYKNVPGLWSDAQLEAWKEITDGVHEKGGFMIAQMWALGRAADYGAGEEEDPSFQYVSASDVQLTGWGKDPRPLTVEEIKEYVQLYVQAAMNAVTKGGFDGVEIHCANGYLIDQFLQDVSNKRVDAYGGSVENRCRFALEVVDAVVAAVGAERTGLRVSPWGDFNDMRMEDPKPTYTYLVEQLKARYPDFGYLSVVEPRVGGLEDSENAYKVPANWSNDFLREIWAPQPLLSAGGYTRQSAIETAEAKGDLIVFGRQFISNPDLVRRLKEDIPLTKYERSTFSLPGDEPKGYTDYPFAA